MVRPSDWMGTKAGLEGAWPDCPNPLDPPLVLDKGVSPPPEVEICRAYHTTQRFRDGSPDCNSRETKILIRTKLNSNKLMIGIVVRDNKQWHRFGLGQQ